MMLVQSTLTVLFEPPFWIGLYERSFANQYEVCKITFGAEPKETEVYNFLLHNWSNLCFVVADNLSITDVKRQNPKRIQRDIQKQLQVKTISTKAQQALQQQHDENKKERQIKTKQMLAAEQEHKFILRQAKKKAKHRGK